VKQVNASKLLESAEPVAKAIPVHGSKSVISLRRSSPDQSQSELPRSRLGEARSKFAGALASSEQPASTAAGRRPRARKDSSVMLRGLDSSGVRVVSGLLTSLMQSENSQLTSAGRCHPVRSEKTRSSLDAKLPPASCSKPSAAVSLTDLY